MTPLRSFAALALFCSCAGDKNSSDTGSSLLTPPDGLGDPCDDDADCPPSLRCLLGGNISSVRNTCVIPCGSSGSGTTTTPIDDTLCRETYGPCFQCNSGGIPDFCDIGICCD